jgi:hypothetical protein
MNGERVANYRFGDGIDGFHSAASFHTLALRCFFSQEVVARSTLMTWSKPPTNHRRGTEMRVSRSIRVGKNWERKRLTHPAD